MHRTIAILKKRASGALACGIIPLLVLLAQACGGGDEDKGPESTPDDASTGTSTPAVTVGEDAGSFEKLAAEYINGVDGRVSYNVDSDNFGFHPVGKWATYRLGTDIREDWTTNAFGYDETTIAINSADGMFLCTQVPDTISCTTAAELRELDAVLILFTPIKDLPGILLGDEAPEYEVTDLPNEELAGIDAECFDVAVDGRIGEGPAGTEDIKFCFSEDGALLAYDRTVTFEAAGLEPAKLSAIAEARGEAAPADFEPPAPPS
jgi:hypothetical protein